KASKTSDNSHYPFNLPESWLWCDICDICEVNPKNKIDDEVTVSFIPMTLISEGFSNKHTSEKRKWGKIKKGFTHFRDGDVGIAKITPCFENRKSVVFQHLENQYGAGTTELHVLRPISEYLSSHYILWFVKTDSFISNGISCFTGAVGQQRVGSAIVKGTAFPLAPVNEQKRIVKKIEEIFTLLDEIENSIKA
ncbi:MAG: restriction endonuclease subunit S, partial [Tannerellaceae bacterium]|nr:restriction endonuclease subunit S [Tannerellaceae bacterium]